MDIIHQAACDMKPASQIWLKATAQKLQHLYSRMSDLAQASHCLIHNCSSCLKFRRYRPDFTSAGIPCQPYTIARRNHHQVPPHQHHDFSSLAEYFGYIDAVKPHSGVVENVVAFTNPLKTATYSDSPPFGEQSWPVSWHAWFVCSSSRIVATTSKH